MTISKKLEIQNKILLIKEEYPKFINLFEFVKHHNHEMKDFEIYAILSGTKPNENVLKVLEDNLTKIKAL